MAAVRVRVARRCAPRVTRGLVARVGVALLSGCVPELDAEESIVRGPRVLAVQAEPAEARPGQPVRYSALFVDSEGVREEGMLQWFYCNAPKPLAELGPINRRCLRLDQNSLERIGSGLAAEATLPSAACSLFGPNPPQVAVDAPPGRPVDPDTTGGYAVPVLLGVDAEDQQSVLLYEQRVMCGLAGVGPTVSADFARRYHPNRNPRASALELRWPDGRRQAVAEGELVPLRRGERLALSVEWPACPQADLCGDGVCGPEESALSCSEDCAGAASVGCEGQERYLWLDEGRRLGVRRESMRVAWYATGGAYVDARTGVDEQAPSDERRSANTWTAPADTGEHSLWLVLRDARGGVGVRSMRVLVQ